MRKLSRRLLAMLLVTIMCLSASVPAMAAPAQEKSEEIYVEGIESFFVKNNDGTMSMDIQAARVAGYTEKSIQFVLDNIEMINDVVRTEGAYLNDDFSVTIYVASSRAARGESKVVVWATGMILVYMNSEEVDDLYSVITTVGKTTSTIMSLLGFLTKANKILSKACNVSAKVAAIMIKMYHLQINQVRQNGTGIIMYVTPMPDGVGTTVSFGAQ